MPKKTSVVPFDVARSIKALGANIRTARLRRNMTLSDAAERLGVTRQALADVELGRTGSSIANFAGMIWLLRLDNVDTLADPSRDIAGIALAERQRMKAGTPRVRQDADYDF